MISKIKLAIKTRKKLFLNRVGEHTSILNGDGLDFKEIREYDSGDDIRHVNWKVTARSGVPSVNVFNDDKQLNIVLVYINSGSIIFGSSRSKQEVMVETIALLGELALFKNDMLSSMFFSSEEEKFVKPTKSKRVLDTNIQIAYDIKTIGKTVDYEALEANLLKKIKKRSIIFLIGDFLDLPNFKYLSKKHELYGVVVRDRLEENLKLNGEFNFVDSSTMSSSEIYLDSSSVKKYNKLMREHDTLLENYFKTVNIRNTKIYTDDSVVDKLSELLR